MAEPARGVVGQLTVNGVRVGGVLSFGVNGPPATPAGKNGKPAGLVLEVIGVARKPG
jgi:hypothetical protein